VWQRPFGAFGRYIQLAAYIGHLAAIHFTEGEARNKRLAHALLLLHSRAIAVAGEILCLMKSGYADGAAARWRTLHEIAVTAAFLIDRGERAAELYLSHWACEQHKGLLHFEEHCRALGYRRHGKRVVNASQCQVDELVKEHGEAFRHDYGWAAVALGIKRATFNDIEKLANAAFMRPHYRLASEQVHASSRGSFIRAGLIEQDPSAAVLLAGPSNYGFADPATNTARSLLLVTSSLGLVDPTIDTNVYGLILSRWMPRVAGEFARTQWQIERREERLNQGFKAIRKPGRRSDTSRRKRNATA
jgi:hypothetical protein